MKRVFDIVCSAVGLFLLAPLGLLIAVAIKLADGGPVFYGQTRVGQFGRPFRIWKFRSMVRDADKLGLPLTSEADRRITPVGRFLRRFKLDELPQLWNVLVGEMSFVGPRPEVPRYVAHYQPEQREILRLKPGITDVASMLFRNEQALLQGCGNVEDFYLRYCLPKKIELNREYARRAGVAQDVWVILQTLFFMLSFAALGGLRLGARLLREHFSELSKAGLQPARKNRIAIVGTGALGTGLAHHYLGRKRAAGGVVAFFDDNPRAWNKHPYGIPVVGMPECLLNTEWKSQVDEVILALPPEEVARARELALMLESAPLKVSFASNFAPMATTQN